MLVAIGAALASIQHRYSAYVLFAVAALMVAAAIRVAHRMDYRMRRGREELGHVLRELSECEHAAHDGKDGSDYDVLIKRINKIKAMVGDISRKYLDSSIESRFLAVNVLDVQLDEATKMHFMSRAQGSFWPVYQQIKGWRACLDRMLGELELRR